MNRALQRQEKVVSFLTTIFTFALIVALSASCSSSDDGDGKGCTLIGCNTGMTVDFSKAAWPAGDYEVAVELDGKTVTCKSTLPLSCTSSQGCDDIGVLLTESGCALDKSQHKLGGIAIVNATPGSVKVDVKFGGASIGSGSWSPVWKTTRPNGPDCDPECKQTDNPTLNLN